MDRAQPAPKQLNLESLAMQAGSKFSGCPTPAEFNFSAARSISTLYNFVAASPRESLANFLFLRSLIAPSAMNFAKK